MAIILRAGDVGSLDIAHLRRAIGLIHSAVTLLARERFSASGIESRNLIPARVRHV